MKLITAVIRPERLNDVLEALFRAEVRGLTLTRAHPGLPGWARRVDPVSRHRAPFESAGLVGQSRSFRTGSVDFGRMCGEDLRPLGHGPDHST